MSQKDENKMIANIILDACNGISFERSTGILLGVMSLKFLENTNLQNHDRGCSLIEAGDMARIFLDLMKEVINLPCHADVLLELANRKCEEV